MVLINSFIILMEMFLIQIRFLCLMSYITPNLSNPRNESRLLGSGDKYRAAFSNWYYSAQIGIGGFGTIMSVIHVWTLEQAVNQASTTYAEHLGDKGLTFLLGSTFLTLAVRGAYNIMNKNSS